MMTTRKEQWHQHLITKTMCGSKVHLSILAREGQGWGCFKSQSMGTFLAVMKNEIYFIGWVQKNEGSVYKGVKTLRPRPFSADQPLG